MDDVREDVLQPPRGTKPAAVRELQEELEALEAIYIHELEVVKNERDEVESIVLQLHPATGDDEDKKYVCMTLQLDPPEQYPDVPPEMVIRNPRGIGDEEIQSLLEDMHKLAMDRRGGPMLYELIELAKESLTIGNIPHCLCMICLEHFFEGERFTRTDCYHYFHKSCLARYVQHFLTHDKESETKKLTLHTNQEEKKVQCPVCREEISYDTDDLTFSPVEEKVFFQPSEEMKTMQTQMAAMLEKQRARGGLIDVDAEKNRFLLKDDDVVQLPSKPVEETSERPTSGGRRNDKASHGRRNRGEHYRGNKSDNSYRKHDDRKDREDYESSRQTGYRDYERPRSGYVRGKGRGRNSDERNNRAFDDKNRKNIEDRQKSGEVKQRNDKEQKKSEITTTARMGEEKVGEFNKEETITQVKAKLATAEASQVEMGNRVKDLPVSKDKKEEMNRPRYDEKINDRHKVYNQQYDNKRQQRDNKRSPRNSSHNKNNSTTGQNYDSNEENTGKQSPKETAQREEKDIDKTVKASNIRDANESSQCERSRQILETNKKVDDTFEESHKSKQPIAGNDKLADGTTEDNKIQKRRGGFGKPKPKDSGFEKSSDRNDNDTERKRPQGGFGVPKSEGKNSDKMERPRSGFGRPNNNDRFRNSRNDRPYSGYDHSKRTSKEDHFGKPNVGFENSKQKSEFNGEGQSRQNQYRRQRPDNDRLERSDWHSGRGNENYGYEKRNDFCRNERNNDSNKKSDSKNWRERKTELKQDGRNYYIGDRERKNDSGYDSSKQNDRVKQSENDRFSRGNHRNENSDWSEPEYQDRSGCKSELKQDISKDFENIHIGDSAALCSSSTSKSNERSQNLRERDCDNEETVDCDRKSHPPGFRVGPPPGFKGKTKGAEEVVKPPPGF